MKRAMSALAVALLAGTAQAQLVVGYDDTAAGVPRAWAYNFGSPGWTPLFTTGSGVNSMAADDAGQRLFITVGVNLYTWNYSDLGGDVAPALVAPVTFNGSGFTVTGMAWNAATGRLYGVKNIADEAMYEIDPVTGIATLHPTLNYVDADYDLGGVDWDPVTNLFYATNDDSTPHGTGLFSMDPATGTIAPILTPYPVFTGQATDVDALAISRIGGELRAYFIPDQPGEIAVYNVTTSTLEAPLTNPFLTSEVFSGGTWAENLFLPATGSDVSVSITDTDPIIVPPGGNVTYSVTVTNLGPDAGTGIVFSMPVSSGTFVSATGGATFSAGTVTNNIGALAASGSVSFDVVLAPAGLGTMTNTATVSSTSTDNNSNNNSFQVNTTVRAPQADLRVTVTDPADCSVGVGGTLLYNIAMDNLGTEAADGATLVVTLPAGTTFVSSNPPLVPSGNTLTLNAGSLGNGGSALLDVQVTANNPGVVTLTATASSSTGDPNGANNSVNADTQIISPPPATAAIKGLFSSIATSTSSDVPGLPGAKFATTTAPGRPYRSPDGSRGIMSWDTDQATTTDAVLIAFDSGGATTVAREGITELPTAQASDPAGPPYYHTGTYDAFQSINDSGTIAYSGIDSRAGTADDGYIVKGSGSLTLVSQESITEAPFGTFFGATRNSVHIANNGTTAFYHTVLGATTATDSGLFANDGATVLAQEGVTVPTNQAGGGAAVYGTFTTGLATGFQIDASHTNWIVEGTLAGAASTSNEIIVVNNDIKLQEGSIIAGSSFTSPVTGVFGAVRMEQDGTWFVYGPNADAIDYVVRNGAVIAQTDAPIFAGATELYDDAPFATTFYMMAGNNNGDYVVGGTTNAADGLANAVVVLNNSVVLLRENDPIDLDNNGAFDDDAYLRTFIDDKCFLSETDFYCLVRIRNGNAAVCGGTDTDLGQALVRIPLPPTGPACDTIDYNNDGLFPDTLDIDDFLSVFSGGPCSNDPNCGDIDFNNDGLFPDTLDIDALLSVFSGGPCLV